MKKKLSILILGIAVIAIAYVYAHIDKNTYLYDRNTDSAELVGTGIPGDAEEVTQSFTSIEDSIDGINLKATLIGEADHVNVEYSLIDEESGKVVRTENVTGEEIKNNNFNVLRFQTLGGTRGKKYILRLAESGTSDNTGVSFYLSEREEARACLR